MNIVALSNSQLKSNAFQKDIKLAIHQSGVTAILYLFEMRTTLVVKLNMPLVFMSGYFFILIFFNLFLRISLDFYKLITWYVLSNESYMNLVINEVFPTDCFPKNTTLYFLSGFIESTPLIFLFFEIFSEGAKRLQTHSSCYAHPPPPASLEF